MTKLITITGQQNLQKELAHIKEVLIPQNLELLTEARDQGDLAENADYHAAREEQGKLHARMNQITNTLDNAKIIEGKEYMLKINNREPKVYTIVGTTEADPTKGFISNESPVGKAVLENPNKKHITTLSETKKLVKIEILS